MANAFCNRPTRVWTHQSTEAVVALSIPNAMTQEALQSLRQRYDSYTKGRLRMLHSYVSVGLFEFTAYVVHVC